MLFGAGIFATDYAMRPDELTDFVQSEIVRWTPIVQSTGLKQ